MCAIDGAGLFGLPSKTHSRKPSTGSATYDYSPSCYIPPVAHRVQKQVWQALLGQFKRSHLEQLGDSADILEGVCINGAQHQGGVHQQIQHSCRLVDLPPRPIHPLAGLIPALTFLACTAGLCCSAQASVQGTVSHVMSLLWHILVQCICLWQGAICYSCAYAKPGKLSGSFGTGKLHTLFAMCSF